MLDLSYFAADKLYVIHWMTFRELLIQGKTIHPGSCRAATVKGLNTNHIQKVLTP